MPVPAPDPTVAAVRSRRRKRWLLLTAALFALVVALAAGCSMLGSFDPAAPTVEMVAAGISGQTVATSDGPVYLVASARREGVAVVFVHGSPGTWDAFRTWLTDPALAARARLVSVDRPGFGGSDRGRAEPSLAAQAQRIEAAVEAIGVEKAILVGHSLGGPVVARMAVDFPERVAGLLLVAPSIDPELEERRWYNVAGSMAVVQWFLPVDWIVSNREIWPLRGELEEMAPRLGSIRVPTIVLQGGEDDLVPPANADFVARAFTGATVEKRMIPGANHFVLWQRPELVRDALLDLLGRAGAAPPMAAPAARP